MIGGNWLDRTLMAREAGFAASHRVGSLFGLREYNPHGDD
jgi:hypothetical protein